MDKKTFYSIFMFVVSGLLSLSVMSCGEDVQVPGNNNNKERKVTKFSSKRSGTRTSLLIGLAVGLWNAVIGIAVGALWGYVRRLDGLLTEAYNVVRNIPNSIILILASYIMRPSVGTMIDNVTWQGNTNRVTFTVGGDSGYRGIGGITVTYIDQTQMSVLSDYMTSCGGTTEVEGVQHTEDEIQTEARKFIKDGKLYIEANGIVYDIFGRIYE